MVAFPDPAALIASLADVGQDVELLKIKDTLAEKAGEVSKLDVANLSPAQLEVTMAGAQDALQGAMDGLAAKANQMKPDLISMQEEIANSLGGVATQLGDKLSGAIGGAGLSLDSLTGGFQASFETPSLSGLDAGIAAAAGAVSDAGNMIKDALGGSSLASKLPSPDLPDIGLPAGPDFGKLIPNVQFKFEPEFDVDGIQIGEKIVSMKLGVQATAPVADDVDDQNPDPMSFIKPAETKGNPILKDNGLLMSAGRAAINTFKESIPTTVTFDEGTGENIVWEKVEGPDGEEITASGYASYAEFEAAYKEGRKSAKGKIKEYLGGLNQMVGQASKLAQDSAKELNRTNKGEFEVPKPPDDFKPTVARKIGIDSITGAPVNIEQVDAIEETVDQDAELFNDVGDFVSPGQDAQEFLEEAKKKLPTGLDKILAKGKPPSLPGSVRLPASLKQFT